MARLPAVEHSECFSKDASVVTELHVLYTMLVTLIHFSEHLVVLS